MRALVVVVVAVVACAHQGPPEPTTTVYGVKWNLQGADGGPPLLCESGETVVVSADAATTTAPCTMIHYADVLGYAELAVPLTAHALRLELRGPSNDVRGLLEVPITPFAYDSPNLIAYIPVAANGTTAAVALSFSLYYQSAMSYGSAEGRDELSIATGGSSTMLAQPWQTDWDVHIPIGPGVVPYAVIVPDVAVGPSSATLSLVSTLDGTTTARADATFTGFPGRTTIADLVTLFR